MNTKYVDKMPVHYLPLPVESKTTEVKQLSSALGPKEIQVSDLKTIVEDTSKAPPAIIEEGILLDETMLLVYGKPKTHKTFLAMNLGLGISAGRGFAGLKTPQAYPVLMLSGEGGYFPMRDR